MKSKNRQPCLGSRAYAALPMQPCLCSPAYATLLMQKALCLCTKLRAYAERPVLMHETLLRTCIGETVLVRMAPYAAPPRAYITYAPYPTPGVR